MEINKIIRLQRKPYVLGVTGNFGVGKNFVGSILKSKGVPVIDTDDIVNDLLKTKNSVTRHIVKEFGKNAISTQPEKYFINKQYLGKVIFGSQSKRNKLESIIHPGVYKQLENFRALHNKFDIVAELVPLLFECNLEVNYHEIWCVICSSKEQVSRLKQKGFSASEIKARIKAQMSQDKKAKRADYVIDNSKSKNETKRQVCTRLGFIKSLLD